VNSTVLTKNSTEAEKTLGYAPVALGAKDVDVITIACPGPLAHSDGGAGTEGGQAWVCGEALA
jgi:hypothetical protein